MPTLESTNCFAFFLPDCHKSRLSNTFWAGRKGHPPPALSAKIRYRRTPNRYLPFPC